MLTMVLGVHVSCQTCSKLLHSQCVGLLYLPPKPAGKGSGASLPAVMPTPADVPLQTLRPSSPLDDYHYEPDIDDQVIVLAYSLAVEFLLLPAIVQHQCIQQAHALHKQSTPSVSGERAIGQFDRLNLWLELGKCLHIVCHELRLRQTSDVNLQVHASNMNATECVQAFPIDPTMSTLTEGSVQLIPTSSFEHAEPLPVDPALISPLQQVSFC